VAGLMLQGTGSDVGKSVLVAGLCRLLSNRGKKVRPFKPQNMSNNAAVTADGGEIGRAQALQALACRVAPHVDMNPVLLKPQSDMQAQVIVGGRIQGSQGAAWYRAHKAELLALVLAAYRRLQDAADVVVVEGAGSPAEINLRSGDIANMGFARAAEIPVVLDPDDATLIRGFLINKFRGDVGLFDQGYRAIAARTGWEALGIVPWIAATARLPAEDAVVLEQPLPNTPGTCEIAVPMLSRIANFDDFDPLRLEPSVHLTWVPPGRPLPASAALVILPGTKATIADLRFFRQQGWDIDLAAHARRGGHVLGLCGGYQMLGERITDTHGVEGPPESVPGLGLLPVETVLQADKVLIEVEGTSLADGQPFLGYEMHVGVTTSRGAPLLAFRDGRKDGTMSQDGRIAGCYVHGLFARAAQRGAWLARLGVSSNGAEHHAMVDAALDELAEALARSVAVDRLLTLAHPTS
jgi:adenosylcobyric acid synthase